MTVTFTPSQLSNTSTTSPLTFRKSPLQLFWSDICLVVHLLRYSIQIILPLPTDNKNGELYLGAGNIRSMALHLILFICSAVGLICAPVVFLFFPGVGFIFFVLGVGAVCAFCTLSSSLLAPSDFYPLSVSAVLECVTDLGISMLNWGPELVDSNYRIQGQDVNDYRFPKEKWFFINGVMVGSFWLQSAINEISRLFERRVVGIRNLTSVPQKPISSAAQITSSTYFCYCL
jgi:hypothetical protein